MQVLSNLIAKQLLPLAHYVIQMLHSAAVETLFVLKLNTTYY